MDRSAESCHFVEHSAMGIEKDHGNDTELGLCYVVFIIGQVQRT